jgi:hypothetical protein
MSKRLPKEVKDCLEKARESALLAVEIYNKPATKFKSGGYIVLMYIAWTSLFHAIFIRNKIKPIYRTKSKKFKRVNGELYYWELQDCIQKYFIDENNPIRKNIEFFIPLRHKIEHKFMPEIDQNIFAECESFLLNFDNIVNKEFGRQYCLRESLSFALQLFPNSASYSQCARMTKDSTDVINYIKRYRNSISVDIYNSGAYSFKAFLIQVANHNSIDALPIQFFPFDKMTDEEKRQTMKIAALVKTKTKAVPVRNLDYIKPSDVVKMVQERLGNPKIDRNGNQKNKFNLDTHTRCWKKYEVRPINGSNEPELTQSEYCVYDSVNENYLYTGNWVEFLVQKMRDDNEYQSLYK